MLLDCGERHVVRRREIRDRDFADERSPHDVAPRGVGESTEDPIHLVVADVGTRHMCNHLVVDYAASSPMVKQSHEGRQSSNWARRDALSAPCRRFASSRRFLAAGLGRVERRRLTGTSERATSCSRSTFAASRLRCWERYLLDTTRISLPTSRDFKAVPIRLRCCSSMMRDARRSQRSSTRVSVVLTCWPPGPEDRLKTHCSSPSGIRNRPWLLTRTAYVHQPET